MYCATCQCLMACHGDMDVRGLGLVLKWLSMQAPCWSAVMTVRCGAVLYRTVPPYPDLSSVCWCCWFVSVWDAMSVDWTGALTLTTVSAVLPQTQTVPAFCGRGTNWPASTGRRGDVSVQGALPMSVAKPGVHVTPAATLMISGEHAQSEGDVLLLLLKTSKYDALLSYHAIHCLSSGSFRLRCMTRLGTLKTMLLARN